VVGADRLQEPDWTDYQGWRYDQPEDSAPTDIPSAAASHDLYFVGDWTGGTPRLQGAFRSGLDTADQLRDPL
jgi:renalase